MIVPLLEYFDRFGYTAPGETVQEAFPRFPMTSLESYLHTLWPTQETSVPLR